MIIRFSYNYCKMPPGYSESELLEVFRVRADTLSKHFIDWNTKKRDGTFFILPKFDWALVLLLRTRSTGLVWTTIRAAYDDAEANYRSRIGEYFECVVT